MMSLRSQYLGDEPVKARLKSLVRTLDPAAAPHLPVLTPVTSYAHISGLSPPLQQQEGSSANNKGKGKKKKNRSKNNPNTNKGNNSQGSNGKKSGNASNNANQNSNSNNKGGSNSNKKAATQQPKPDLSAASFPALSNGAPKVEVVVDGSGMEAAPTKPSGSDSASTTTTLSSSSSSVTKQGKQVTGGYAAALRKAKPANAPSAPKVRYQSLVVDCVGINTNTLSTCIRKIHSRVILLVVTVYSLIFLA